MSTTFRAIEPTPLLNRPNFDQVFQELPVDDQGLLRAVEMVALPGTRFTLLNQVSVHIIEIKTADYPTKAPIYIDTRFTIEDPNATDRKKILPPPNQILTKLEASLGLPYVWGGNWGAGIPKIHTLYPSAKDPTIQTLRGVDCSGLLYEATNGYTPRNTSALINFGSQVPSLSDLKPLDIIVWLGHTIICFDKDTVIESSRDHGVILSNLKERIELIQSEQFLLRRFI